MTSAGGEPDLVENRYRTALSHRLPTVERRAHDVGQVFDDVQVAMRLGAWTSSGPVADDFVVGCEAHERSTESAADECASDVRAKRDRQPFRVERGDRRATWG